MRTRLLYVAVVWVGVMLASAFGYVGASAGPAGGYGSTPIRSAQPPGVDCKNINARELSRQTNPYAAWQLIYCGYAQGGSPQAVASNGPIRRNAPTIGGMDANVVLPDGTYPKVTQSESMVWSNGSTIVTAFNDSRAAPTCSGNVSYSTDGGATWQIGLGVCNGGHGRVAGDPIVVYNAHLSTWYVGFIAIGCGGQGLGLWSSTDGQTWTTGACSHMGTGDDRESMWVDNNPASPYYGRMYISWNNLSAGQYSVNYSDDGTTWSTPVSLGVGAPFLRNGQVTGSPNGDGAVFVSGHTEGATNTTYMFRSTNGGANWTQIIMNSFSAAGAAGLPGCSFRAITPIWRVPEWGAPAVGGQVVGQNVVNYVYAAAGTGGDLGDVYYVRSTDNGSTWAVPFKLNTDGTTQPQWQPAISADANGGIVVGWYDRRNTTNGTNYEYFGRISTDNGATWQTDEAISDVLVTQPQQTDPAFSACYAGDYNYHTAFGSTHFMTWTDGRNQISGANQQDVYFDSVTVGGGGGTATPTLTRTATSVATNTAPPSATHTGIPSNTATPSNTPTNTSTNTASNTATSTPSRTATDIPTGTPTNTATSTPTSTIANTATATPTVCVVPFTDVQPGDWYYTYVQWMYCHGVINGYSTNPPCATGAPCFMPGNLTTRGQTAKIVVLAFGFPLDTSGGPHFSDVAPGTTFYNWIETAYNLELINGYGDGTYRPNNDVSRGQIAKIVVNAAIMADPAHWTLLDPASNTFEDVEVGSTFFQQIETAVAHDVIDGYPCGTPPAGACVGPGNKPYFLPGDNATRAQISKIVYLAVTFAPGR